MAEAHELLVNKVDLRSTVWSVPSTAGQASLARKIPQVSFDDVMAAPGEVTAVAPTALGDASKTVTAARQALRYDPSDEYLISGGPVGVEDLGKGLYYGYIRRAAALIGDIVDGFTATSSSSGNVLTVDLVMGAIIAYEQNDNVDSNPTLLLSPKQFTDFQSSLRGEGGSAQYQAATEAMQSVKPQGFKGTWRGMQIITSASVKNDGTDDFGALYSMKAVALLELSVGALRAVIPSNEFMNIAQAGDVMFVEKQRDADKALTELVGNAYMGVALNEDELGVTIQTVD